MTVSTGAGPGSTVVRYRLDDETEVAFEVDDDSLADVRAARALVAADDQDGAANGEVERITDAVRPAVAGAKAVLAALKEIGPDQVEVTFGIKVTGSAGWLVAKAATEASFEVTLTWGSTGTDPA